MINNNYEINIKENTIHIKKYIEIQDIKNDQIIIKLKNNKLIIKGDNIIINKMDEYEILMHGIIKGIEIE